MDKNQTVHSVLGGKKVIGNNQNTNSKEVVDFDPRSESLKEVDVVHAGVDTQDFVELSGSEQ